MFPLDGEDAVDEEEETRRDYGLHLLQPMRLRTSVIEEKCPIVNRALFFNFIKFYKIRNLFIRKIRNY